MNQQDQINHLRALAETLFTRIAALEASLADVRTRIG